MLAVQAYSFSSIIAMVRLAFILRRVFHLLDFAARCIRTGSNAIGDQEYVEIRPEGATDVGKALSRSALAGLDLLRLFSTMSKISYAGYRFPPEIIQQAIWLYVRFTLSFRDVEDLLAERGIMV